MALVPARGGSRGIIGKNLARIGQAPLISRTIATLSQVSRIRRI
ncbi:MAG TPA: acylneuraminate cytidylyltransferase, partial [Acidimicrobiia bacterium]|nr:acylneuraminate cytidylyltransferase [Acidimicrobiia bacterium]